MDLRHLTDACLLSETKRHVDNERNALTLILHHLYEVNRRRLFGDHPSLHVYACNELKYSDDQTQRRTSAMRVMSDLPEIEPWIRSGDISLTHIGHAKSTFERRHADGRPLSRAEKLDVFRAMLGKSTRVAEAQLRELSGDPPPRQESVRALGWGRFRVIIELNEEDLDNLKTVRGRLAHRFPGLSMGELVGHLLKLGLSWWDPGREPEGRTKEDSKAAVNRQVWRRDGGKCVRCGSTHAVEIDHIQPKSMGGEDTLENMRLLCRTCNQRAAIEKLGLDKMDPFISPAAPRVDLG